MTSTTLIRQADLVIAWDAATASHCYLRNADVVFSADTFSFVGKHYSGEADHIIEGSGLMLMPGLINMHSHPASEPGNRGITEDAGSTQFGQSTLYEYLNILDLGVEGARAAALVAYSEMLKSGVTTVVDLSALRADWITDLAATGMRAVLCPMVRSGHWLTRDGLRVEYEWDEAAGLDHLQSALAVIDEARSHPSKRLDGMLGPAQLDTCTLELLQTALAAAQARDIPLQTHAAQSVIEFQEITRRSGLTPIAFMHEHGLLNEQVIIGHAIFLNDHPWLHWPQGNDFERLRDSGAAIAHCPVNFSRRGIALHYLRRYLDAGITVTLGTDTYPHNMLNEMHIACVAARLTSGAFDGGTTHDVFNAATIGAAKALKRHDLGRIAPACKADFVLVDLHHPYMQPARDPLRSLVFSAADRAVRDVYVAGQALLKNGELLTIDIEPALATLNAGQQYSMQTFPQRDWAGRDIDSLVAPVFPLG